jgi:hypothetical protein
MISFTKKVHTQQGILLFIALEFTQKQFIQERQR